MSDGPTFARLDPQNNINNNSNAASNNNNNNNNNSNNANLNNNNNNNNNNNGNDAVDFDSWVAANTVGDDGIAAVNANNFTDAQIEAWRERERRQRFPFLMFLVLLLLMDGDDQNQRRHRQQQRSGGLRGAGPGGANKNPRNRRRRDNLHSVESDMELYRARRTLDSSIEDIVLFGNHSRVQKIVERNDGWDTDREIRLWAEEQKTIQTRIIYEQLLKDLVLEQPDGSFVKVLVASRSNNEAITVVDNGSSALLDVAAASASATNPNTNTNANTNTNTNHNTQNETTESGDELKDAMKKFDAFQDAEREIWHYPWNATGYYRGDWKLMDERMEPSSSNEDDVHSAPSSGAFSQAPKNNQKEFASQRNTIGTELSSPLEAERRLLEHLQKQVDPSIGLHVLPPGMELKVPGFRDSGWNTSEDSPGLRGSFRDNKSLLSSSSSSSSLPNKLSLTKSSGTVAFQLYSKAVPTMNELSLIDGYVKLYDSNTLGYSTRRDVLMRVHGVLVHSLGKLSLVANTRSRGRAALLVNAPPGGKAGSHSQSKSSANAKQKHKQQQQQRDSKMKTETRTAEATLVSEESAEERDYDDDRDTRRRLRELLSSTTKTTTNKDTTDKASDDARMEEIRNHALKLFSSEDNYYNDHDHDHDHEQTDRSSYTRTWTETDDPNPFREDDLGAEFVSAQQQKLSEEQEQNANQDGKKQTTSTAEELQTGRRLKTVVATQSSTTAEAGESVAPHSRDRNANVIYSKHVVPFPFAWDDPEHSLQQILPPSARSISGREQSLERNAGSCEFEFNLDVQEEKWTIGQWKNLISRNMYNEMLGSALSAKLKQGSATAPFSDEYNGHDEEERKAFFKKPSKSSTTERSKSQKRPRTEQAWVMLINGTVVSPNCDFRASVNTTAIRTDWESTTGKAVNYSFCMMATCLTQIVLLMRQLLHTQSQSASMRVSLLCIGWQTVIDALLCLVHIYLSLAMHPLFTTFASVAFFKLLIFCVIEMKYMAIIIQARNAHNGTSSAELLRRQIAMLHLRFYVALMSSCLGFFYSENYRTTYMLILYSFWVPQIVHNVFTEAKKPMNAHYIYGMSVTRMVAPLYMFGVQGNFMKEIYPESPTNVFMCQLLVAWVGIQAGILHAQSRFGARFFIPALFLPPKYDYNRPIPSSVLQSNDETENPSDQLKKEREAPKTEVRPLSIQKTDLSSRGGVARNRKEGKRTKGETSMTAETVTEVPKKGPCIECVICYNDIDASNRTAYMIAPCDHVFHKDCLVQWMEVKMECPICRQRLPAP